MDGQVDRLFFHPLHSGWRFPAVPVEARPLVKPVSLKLRAACGCGARRPAFAIPPYTSPTRPYRERPKTFGPALQYLTDGWKQVLVLEQRKENTAHLKQREKASEPLPCQKSLCPFAKVQLEDTDQVAKVTEKSKMNT